MIESATPETAAEIPLEIPVEPAGEVEAPTPLPPLEAGETYHWTIVAGSTLILLASVLLQVRSDVVFIPGFSEPLPGTCVSREFAGVNCPGCGLTRSFICLAHGDLVGAWHYNPSGMLIFALIAVQIPFRLYQIWRIRGGLPEAAAPWLGAGWVVMAFVMILQWIVRTSMGVVV